MEEAGKRKLSKKAGFWVLIGGLGVVLVGAGIGLGFWLFKPAAPTAKDLTASGDRAVQEVSDIYQVPTNETPSVALVQKKEALAGEQFFKDAQDGDYVIVYKQAHLGIIYRESTHKIITVGPVSYDTGNSNGNTGASSAPAAH